MSPSNCELRAEVSLLDIKADKAARKTSVASEEYGENNISNGKPWQFDHFTYISSLYHSIKDKDLLQ